MRCCWHSTSRRPRARADRFRGICLWRRVADDLRATTSFLWLWIPDRARMRSLVRDDDRSSRQRVHDHGTGDRRRLPDQERSQILIDPRQRTLVGLLGAGKIVEQADCGHGVVAGIDDIIGPETFDIADDGDGAFLDPTRQLFGRSGLRLGLTDGGIHGILLPAVVTTGGRGRRARTHPTPASAPKASAFRFTFQRTEGRIPAARSATPNRTVHAPELKARTRRSIGAVEKRPGPDDLDPPIAPIACGGLPSRAGLGSSAEPTDVPLSN